MWLSIVPLSFHLQSHLLQLDFNWHIIKYVCHTDVQCSHELMDYAFKLAMSMLIYSSINHILTVIPPPRKHITWINVSSS